MRIMDTVEESDLLKIKREYVRVAHKGLGSSIKIIGNIIKNNWREQNECSNGEMV